MLARAINVNSQHAAKGGSASFAREALFEALYSPSEQKSGFFPGLHKRWPGLPNGARQPNSPFPVILPGNQLISCENISAISRHFIWEPSQNNGSGGLVGPPPPPIRFPLGNRPSEKGGGGGGPRPGWPAFVPPVGQGSKIFGPLTVWKPGASRARACVPRARASRAYARAHYARARYSVLVHCFFRSNKHQHA